MNVSKSALVHSHTQSTSYMTIICLILLLV